MNRINVETQWTSWWAGADGRITKMGGDPEKEWIKRRLKGLYDPGQNLNILLESKTGLRDINIFEFPGLENCSSFIASFFDCGNHAIGRPGLADFEELPHVHETADIAPGHFGMSQWFEKVQPGEPLRAGYVMMHMNWPDPAGDAKMRLLEIVMRLILTRASLGAIRDAYKAAPEIFADGIKQVSRDYFEIPEPFWRATYADLIWRIADGIAFCVGQEAYLKQYFKTTSELYAKMEGKTPELVVVRPKFLYG